MTPGEADHERSNAEDEEPVRYHTELAKFRKMRSFRPQTKKHLSEEHYFLFPRHVVGFALGKKQRSRLQPICCAPSFTRPIEDRGGAEDRPSGNKAPSVTC